MLGWTPPRGSRTGLGSLHLGYYDPQGKLHYAGGVGTGFSDDELGRLRERLDGAGGRSAEGSGRGRRSAAKTIHWVRPELVAEIQFASWSGAGRVRQAVYLGLREDKAAIGGGARTGRPRGGAQDRPAAAWRSARRRSADRWSRCRPAAAAPSSRRAHRSARA